MTKRILLGLMILGITIAVIAVLIMMRPQPPKKKPYVQSVVVQTKKIEAEDVQFFVDSQGPVLPVTNTNLVAEVSGRITKVSDSFRVGSFVEKDDVLLEIDPANYIASVRSAEANLAQAKANLQDAQARTDQARKDWKKIGRGEPTDLVLKLPQLNQAKASVQSAEAALFRARQDLERTKVRASFDALIKSKTVGLGQFVNTGSQVATLYGTDYAEVRLPVPDQELAYLSIPNNTEGQQPDVRLIGTFAGQPQEWFGKIVRTEGVVEESNRLTYLVAQVKDPYNLKSNDNPNPLRFGTFVKAEIAGKEKSGLVKLPRQSLYFGDTVLLLENESEVKLQKVELARTQANTVFIEGGLETNDEVITSPVHNPVNGMKVQRVGDESSAPKAAEKKADSQSNNTANL